MKKNLSLIVGIMISTSLLADQQPTATDVAPATTNAPVADVAPAVEPAPAAVTPEPAAAEAAPAKTAKAKPAKKKKGAKVAAKKTAVEEKPIMLVAGPATVIGSNVNVRAQAKLSSEVVTHLHTGDSVTVIEQVNLTKTKPQEPRQWAKIALPASTEVWVFSSFIDVASNNVVIPKKLNLRAGPGENFSVVGTAERGTEVKQIQVKGSWMQIEAPAGAYAFVAARLLNQEPAPAETATVPTETLPTNAAPTDVATTEPAVAPTVTEPTPAPEPVVIPRVVTHEGLVKPTMSIQAPTPLQLVSPETGAIINYLYNTNSDLNLDSYNGRRIVVTGEESLDERWLKTPVLTVQHIQVVE